MKIYLLNPALICSDITALQQDAYQEILACASLTRHKYHHLVSQTEDADMIIAPIQFKGYGPFFRKLKKSEIYRTHKKKTFVYCPDDYQYPSLPGVFPAITQEWVHHGWALGGHYLSRHIDKFNFKKLEPSERNILFSFLGSSRTHPLREEILKLRHPRSFLFDSSSKSEEKRWYEKGEDALQQMRNQFEEVVSRSKFALCPKGRSASSMRLFEAMQAGCVPVIISDQLVLPKGPDWETFTVFVPEREIANLPNTLEQVEPRFEAMSIASRKTWEEFFSPESSFETLVGWCAELQQELSTKDRAIEELRVAVGEGLRPQNIRTHLREARTRYLTH